MRRTRDVKAGRWAVLAAVVFPLLLYLFLGLADADRRVREFWGDPVISARIAARRIANALTQRGVQRDDLAQLAEELSRGTPKATAHDGPPRSPDEVAVPGADLAVRVDPALFSAAQAERRHATRARFLRGFAAVASIALLLGLLAVERLRRSERDADERALLAAAAAHEIRSSLASIRLDADLLAADLGDPTKSREYARVISEEAARLSRVASNVLGLAQLQRGRLRVQPAPGNLTAAVSGAIAGLAPLVAARGAHLVLEDSDEVLFFPFDRDALGQILDNLVDNAEKYTRQATDRRIHVRVRREADGVSIQVEDHGPGLPRVLTRSAFRPNSRGETGPGGLGLGLSMVRALARAHGGEAHHEARAKGGTRMSVHFVKTGRTAR